MSKYVDLVLARTECGMMSVLIAPSYSGLKKDDIVVVEVNNSSTILLYVVERVLTCAMNSDEYKFIKKLREDNGFAEITGAVNRFEYESALE